MKDCTGWTLQRLYNHISRHLIKQNKRSICGNHCRMMDAEGNRCSYGCLLSKKDFHKLKLVNITITRFDFPVKLTCDQNYLMTNLMLCHDCKKPSRWPQRLRAIARQYQLEIPVCLQTEEKTNV